ncbi:hypothetical protein C8E03_11198 [Lachnotalea glycerini]|jgi:hypothetical protein|uniref:Uncharacterized protein n=1 Tax=Lachnotalea glycerini TaxID=1763509 RepID=A0A255I900_9FIRM|nr:hypothetical protein [Lachnotalea glycerini]OYO50999.1 hypothetical protein CG709_20210 [Lachnotalea glycerini]PXV86898.1 hypothetical protein C8E03_11198 [Lachnotalea glycerini]RDY30448.1 hypothetical protein CG710_014720 [Lachnotalea glycerini]
MLDLSIKEQKKILGGNYYELMIFDSNGNIVSTSSYGTKARAEHALEVSGLPDGYHYRISLVIED